MNIGHNPAIQPGHNLSVGLPAHRRAVGAVDVEVLGPEDEGVPAGIADVALTLGARGRPDRLDALDLPRIGQLRCRPAHPSGMD
jgi:hypothetical protein